MARLFTAPLSELSPADVAEIVRLGAAESGSVEFKEALQGDGAAKKWAEKKQITSDATKKILKEMVAFANAHGGHLILGIAESDEKPPVAERVTPLPNCADLAERLSQKAQDLIDPPIPLLNIIGLPTESDGSGIIIVRVERSRLAPHRGPDRECHSRRDTRSEPMDMREIQDLTLQRMHGASALNSQFEDSSKEFLNWLGGDGGKPFIAMRFTAIPIWPIHVGRVRSKSPCMPMPRGCTVTLPTHSLTSPAIEHGIAEHSLVRGWTRYRDGSRSKFRQSAFEYGNGEIWSRRIHTDGTCLPALHMAEVSYLLGNTLRLVRAMREAAAAPGAEYALEWQLQVNHPRTLLENVDSNMCEYNEDTGLKSQVFPRLRVGPEEEWNDLTAQLFDDIISSAGGDEDLSNIEIDIS